MTDDMPISPPHTDARGLTPADIYHKEFKRAVVGGYDMRQVDEFLTRVGDAFDALVLQVQLLKERDHEQREQLQAFREMEETLRNTLVTSQKFSENITETAKREADALIEEAHLIKARAQFEAGRLPAEMAEDVRQLKERRERLRLDMLSVLDTHRNLLNTMTPAEDRIAEETPKPDIAHAQAETGPTQAKPGKTVPRSEARPSA